MNIPLGVTEAVKWIDGSNTYDLEKLVLNGTTIWELATDITGTAAYNPISRTISMDVTLGNLDSWSWRAQKFGGGGDTGENAVSGVPYAESSEFGVSDDGTWTVTFKGFKNGTHRSTHQVSVIVATPFIEITNIETLVKGVRITGTARNMFEQVLITSPRGGGGTTTYESSVPSSVEEFDITSLWPSEAGIIKSKTYSKNTRQSGRPGWHSVGYTSNLYLEASGRMYTNQAANWTNIKVYVQGVLVYEQPGSSIIRGEVEYLNTI
jgi:hypothetical protein